MKKPTKTQKKILIITGAIVLVIALAVASVFIWWAQSTKPYDASCTDAETCDRVFSIQTNDSFHDIADRLEQDQLIRSSLAFQIYARLSGDYANVQAGSYIISKSNTLEHILTKFTTGDVESNVFRITFLPGETLTKTRERFLNAGYTDDEITAGFNADYGEHPVFTGAPADATLEGFIYGETYEFYIGTSVSTIIERTLDELWSVIQANKLVDKYENLGFTLYEGITLASVVQKESSTESTIADMPTVAQVFELRLKKGITLGSDAIIAYRADQINPNRDKTDWTIYTNQIKGKCPWDSRSCTGLPPNPISAPSSHALIAVGNPTNTDYLFFLTGDDGKMYYARTDAEHEANKVHCPVLCGYL